jgi:NAD(P)-dependent dehydrogenase (short-subunit alcohol dehydrogenase family)
MESFVKVCGAAVIVGVLSGLSKIFLSRKPTLPYDELFREAQVKYSSSDKNFPLLGKVAIVTGSTSGLGREIALNLFRVCLFNNVYSFSSFLLQMGATVVLASRTQKKIIETKAELLAACPASKGQLITDGTLDTSDFRSVVEFAKWVRANFKEIEFLVNNAGTIYVPPADTFDPQNPPTSKQGYELAFSTNYLGHFLLTELLLPLLRGPSSRILHVGSTAHLTVDGSDLRIPPSSDGSAALPTPKAARPCSTMTDWVRAYGNNKLAMLLHAKELTKVLQPSGPKV